MSRRITLLQMLVIPALVALVAGTGVVLAHGGDSSLIHGCIEKVGKAVRILAAPGIGDPSAACKAGETAIDWNQAGQAGAAGPTSVVSGGPVIVPEGTVTVVSHTVTAEEAGLNVLIASVHSFDRDGTTGGATSFNCQLNGAGMIDGDNLLLRDTGEAGANHRETASTTLITRGTLAEDDVVSVTCRAIVGDGDEASAQATILLERVSS